jgi:hypothetical protein
MIWAVKQFITHQTLEMGGERVRFPIRVELEYEQEGIQVFGGSLHKKILYNKSFLLKRYVELKERDLDLLVEKGVHEAIEDYLASEKLLLYENNHSCCGSRRTLAEEKREK